MKEDTASKNDPYTDSANPDNSADTSEKDGQTDITDDPLSASDVSGNTEDDPSGSAYADSESMD